MTDKFVPGEIAILQKSEHWPERLGEEVEVMSEARHWLGTSREGAAAQTFGHEIKFRDGFILCVMPHCLRKKRPPRDDGWKEIERITEGWNPTGSKAVA